MSAVDEFSQLISGIYSAVLDPEQWDTAMAAIGRALGSGAGLVVTDATTRTLEHAAIPTDAAISYAGHFARIDHVLSTVEAGPLAVIRPGAELMWPYAQEEFVSDWARPNGFDDGMFVRLTATRVTTSLALASPKQSDRFDTVDRVALVNRLIPHLQQALRMQGRLDDLDHRRGDLREASEAVGHGIVFVERRMSVYANTAAERILRAADGLRIVDGCIKAQGSRADAQLGDGIARASNLDSGDIWGGSFLCPRPSGRRPYIVHVLPIKPKATAPHRNNRAMVIIVDPELQPQPPTILLRRLYGLTNSEAQVALLVMRGEGLTPIAEGLCVSLTTVKTHLRHVFDKTGVHRQAELVRLLATLDPLRR